MIRSIVAIIVGFLVIGALSVDTDLARRAALPGRFLTYRMDDPALLVLTLAYVFAFAVFGCWLAGERQLTRQLARHGGQPVDRRTAAPLAR